MANGTRTGHVWGTFLFLALGTEASSLIASAARFDLAMVSPGAYLFSAKEWITEFRLATLRAPGQTAMSAPCSIGKPSKVRKEVRVQVSRVCTLFREKAAPSPSRSWQHSGARAASCGNET